MLKAALVDDEAIIVEGLLSSVEWEAYGFEVVLSTTQPRQLLEYLEHHPLDLLVTDVSMPDINGIDLLRQAKKRYPSLAILVVSAYDRFDFVKTALREGAENYLLKPIDQEELRESLSQIASHMQNQPAAPSENGRGQISSFRSNLIERWVKNTISYSELLEKSAVMGVDLSAASYTVVIFRLKNAAQAQDAAQGLYDTVLSCAARKLYGQFYFEDAATLVCVLSPSSNERPAAFATEVCRHLFQAGNACFAVVSDTVLDCAEVPRCFAAAYGLLFMAWSQETLLLCGGPPLPGAFTQALQQLEDFGAEQNFAQAARLCSDLFSSAAAPAVPQKRLAILLCAALLHGAGKNAPNLFSSAPVRQGLEQFPPEGTPAEYSRWLSGFFSLCDQAQASLQQVMHPCVAAAIRKLQDFANPDLSIKTVAAQMGVSPAYLGHLFRQQTGVYFNDYLTNIRLEYAKELISTTGMKINEIVEKTGFASQTYFNRIFKRTFGVVPLAYRREKRMERLS